jgi:hypothetical protein
MVAVVDWRLIGMAMGFYEGHGFKRVDLPWDVSWETAKVTCPDAWRMFGYEDRVLVGSAEQSFMETQFLSTLPPGRYVSCTPCFRNEPVTDELHQKQFMKVELYSNESHQEGLAVEFAQLAQHFFFHHGYAEAQLVETDEGFDLEVADVEVGSYSSRVHNGHAWTCGTGLAEPRFSTAKERLRSR